MITNCKICVSSNKRAKFPEIEFYQDIEDKHIITIGIKNPKAGRVVSSDYIDKQLIPYIEMVYDISAYKYISVAVPDTRESTGHEYYAEMFKTI